MPAKRFRLRKEQIKWAALTLAAVVTVLGFALRQLSAAGAPTVRAYRESLDNVCAVANSEQIEAANEITQFKRSFPHATTVTRARELILKQVQEQITAVSDVISSLDGVRPAPGFEKLHAHLIELLKDGRVRLQNYMSELDLLSSPLQLAALVQAVPRAELNLSVMTIRSLLLSISGDCQIDHMPVIPPVEWSPQLRVRIRHAAEQTARGVEHPTPPTASAGNGAPSGSAAPVATRQAEIEYPELRTATDVPAETLARGEAAERAEEGANEAIMGPVDPSKAAGRGAGGDG